jgi:CheY-like chemotaxis protein
VPLRRFFRTALGHAGFKVREVGDGLTALQALDDERPDVVVLDLELPVVSGHVVSQEIAAQAQTRDIPVVVVVTGTTGVDVERLKVDVDCVLTKPITAERLVDVVRECLASKKMKGRGG